MKRKEPAKAGFREEANFEAFLLYEDKPTGLRAKLVLDGVLDQLSFACRCSPRLWRLDLLNWTNYRELAAKEAAEADLILVSLHGNRNLPAATFDWINLWLRRRSRRLQVIAILLDKAHFRRAQCEETLYGFSCLAYAQGLTVFRNFQDPPCEANGQTQIAMLPSRLHGEITKSVIALVAEPQSHF
jgi:hypothetical protein